MLFLISHHNCMKSTVQVRKDPIGCKATYLIQNNTIDMMKMHEMKKERYYESNRF